MIIVVVRELFEGFLGGGLEYLRKLMAYLGIFRGREEIIIWGGWVGRVHEGILGGN